MAGSPARAATRPARRAPSRVARKWPGHGWRGRHVRRAHEADRCGHGPARAVALERAEAGPRSSPAQARPSSASIAAMNRAQRPLHPGSPFTWSHRQQLCRPRGTSTASRRPRPGHGGAEARSTTRAPRQGDETVLGDLLGLSPRVGRASSSSRTPQSKRNRMPPGRPFLGRRKSTHTSRPESTSTPLSSARSRDGMPPRASHLWPPPARPGSSSPACRWASGSTACPSRSNMRAPADGRDPRELVRRLLHRDKPGTRATRASLGRAKQHLGAGDKGRQSD